MQASGWKSVSVTSFAPWSASGTAWHTVGPSAERAANSLLQAGEQRAQKNTAPGCMKENRYTVHSKFYI